MSGQVSKGPGQPPKNSQKRVSWRVGESKITCIFLTRDTHFWLVLGGQHEGPNFGKTLWTYLRRVCIPQQRCFGQASFCESAALALCPVTVGNRESQRCPCSPAKQYRFGLPEFLVAFHPRPQIASDLGCNVTRNFNPHRNRNQFPSGNEILAYGRRLKSQPASTRCDLRIASPTRPFLQVIWTPQIANPQAANRRIAGHNRAELKGTN